MAERTQEILLRVKADTQGAGRNLEGITKRLDAIGASLKAVSPMVGALTEALGRLSPGAGDTGRRLGSVARGVAKIADPDAVQRVNAMADALRGLASQIERVASGAGALRPLMGPLARAGGGAEGVEEIKRQSQSIATSAGPISAALEQIRQQAKAAGVNIDALGSGLDGLGKALDKATDPLNELRNGIDGLGDRLVLFGEQGELLRTEIEKIRDPALRAKVANEQWAASTQNLNGTMGRLADHLQVAKVRAAAAVGGVDNLNRIMLAAAAGVGILIGALVKLGQVLVEVVAKGLKEYQSALEGAKEKQSLMEAQSRSLDHSIGESADRVLHLTRVQDGLNYQMAQAGETLDMVTRRYMELHPAVRATIESKAEYYGALATGQWWLVGFGHRTEEAAKKQEELQKQVKSASEVFRAHQLIMRQVTDATKAFGTETGRAIDEISGKLSRMLALEQGLGKGDAAEVQRLAGQQRRRGGGGGGRQLGVLERVFGEGFLPNINADQSAIMGALDNIVEDIERHRINELKPALSGAVAGLFGPGVNEGLAFMQRQVQGVAETVERLSAPMERFAAGFRAATQASRDFARDFGEGVGQTLQQTIAGVTGAIGEGLGKLFSGASDQSFKQWTASLLSSVASMWGDLFIAQGAALVFVNPAQGLGLLGAGAGLKALAATFGAVGGGGSARSSGGGGGGGASSAFVAPSLGDRPELAQRRTEIVLQVGREVLGRVIEDEVNARISLNRILNVPATAR